MLTVSYPKDHILNPRNRRTEQEPDWAFILFWLTYLVIYFGGIFLTYYLLRR